MMRRSAVVPGDRGGGRASRRQAAAGVALALSLAVLCFATLASRGPQSNALMEQGLLSSTQREERAIILKRREDMVIKAAEARLMARISKRQRAASIPQVLHGAQPAKREQLRKVPTPAALKREFQQYTSNEKAIEARIKNTESTHSVADQPALVLTNTLKERQHAPIQNPAVAFVQPAARVPTQEARVRELSQIVNEERKMVKRAETEDISLREEVHHDAWTNSQMQQALWKEDETVALMHRALARDAILKQELAAKDMELALKTQQLDRVEDELNAHHADTDRAAPRKPESVHQAVKQEFNSVARDKQAIVQDMHRVAAQDLANPVAATHPANATPILNTPSVEQHYANKSAQHVKKAVVQHTPARANYDDSTGYMKAPARSSGDLHASAKQAAQQHLAIKAKAGPAPRVQANAEMQARVLSEANTDASSLASTKAKLEDEMKSIEASEDQALAHIKDKMQALDDDDGDYVQRLILDANSASPDDRHPKADEVKRNTPYDPLADADQAKMQVLMAKPKPGIQAAKPVLHKTAEHTPLAHTDIKPPRLHTAKAAEESKAKHVQRKSKGALSDDALKAVENLAREGDDDEHKARKTAAHTAKAAASKALHAAMVHEPKKAAAKTAGAVATADDKAVSKAPAEVAEKVTVAAPAARMAASKTAAKTARGSEASATTNVKVAAIAGTVGKAHKPVSLAGKAIAAKGAGGKGEINPMAEISMALKAEKLFDTIGNGQKHAPKSKAAPAPAASSAPAPAAAAANQETASTPAAVTVPSKKSSSSSAAAIAASKAKSRARSKKTESSSNAEIDPLSIIDKAFAEAEKAHAAKLVAQQLHKKVELHAAAQRKRADQAKLAKLNTELHLKSTANTPGALAHQLLADVSPAAKQALVATDKHQPKAASTRAYTAVTAASNEEMDPLAVIEQALVKEKKAGEDGTQQQKGGDKDTTGKPKPGSLLDLFGKKVAKSVGNLMDKVHRSEGRTTVKPAKPKSTKAKMSEVERLAKLIDTHEIKGSKGSVHTARMENEIDSASHRHPHLHARLTHAAVTPPAAALTKGQIQEQKDKTAEVDLETLYKKGLLVHHAAVAAPVTTEVVPAMAVALPARPLQSSKDIEAMRDLEKMQKVCV